MKEKLRTGTQRAFAYFKLIGIRTIAAVILGGIFFYVGYLIDFAAVNNQQPKDFISYSQFSVQNARVGEDVNFKICRTFQRSYKIDNTLNIYVIQRSEDGKDQPVQVYGEDSVEVLNETCDNKKIKYKDFQHEAGTYEIRACTDFKVRYDIPKQVCETSNQYKVYDTAQNLQEQLERLKKQTEILEQQISDADQASSQNVITNNNGSAQGMANTGNSGTSGNTANPGGSTGGNGGTGGSGGNGGGSNNGGGGETETPGPNILDMLVNGAQDLTCGTVGLLCR